MCIPENAAYFSGKAVYLGPQKWLDMIKMNLKHTFMNILTVLEILICI